MVPLSLTSTPKSIPSRGHPSGDVSQLLADAGSSYNKTMCNSLEATVESSSSLSPQL